MLLLASLLALLPAAAGPLQIELVEQQALPAVPRAVVVDALLARVELQGLTPAQVKLVAKKSTICPRTVISGSRTLLSCTSRKLTAVVDKSALTLRTTRGPADVYAPVVSYVDVLGGACPGKDAAARAECAFVDGRTFDAALELKDEYTHDHEHRGHASLRLGDLAWRAGDVEAAARWYDNAGPGPFGRLAATRLCELLNCLDGPSERIPFDTFDDGGLPASIKGELTLRRARALAASSRLDDAVRLLVPATSTACGLAPALCRKIATAALLERSGRDAAEALAVALQIPSAFDGEGAVDLAAAVVDHTDRLGAPLFTANVLAATSSQVEPAVLDAWILRSAERYLDAADDARAQAVLAFAKSRGFTAGKNAVRWRAARIRLTEMQQTANALTETKPQTKAEEKS